MIRSFKDRQTEKLFESSNSRRIPAEIIERARRKLMSLHAAHLLDDLRVPPSNRMERLRATGKGNTRSGSMISGASAFGLKKATRSTLKFVIIIEAANAVRPR